MIFESNMKHASRTEKRMVKHTLVRRRKEEEDCMLLQAGRKGLLLPLPPFFMSLRYMSRSPELTNAFSWLS